MRISVDLVAYKPSLSGTQRSVYPNLQVFVLRPTHTYIRKT